MKIERKDTAKFPTILTGVFADCVSAVALGDVPKFDISDPTLEKIYNVSLKTLKECEQDVFEDGPKRDRRLWIGDFRLQALTDNVTFQNSDLIKRCIYLFSAYRNDTGYVGPFVFPDSPPYVDGWYFLDYALLYISCLYDYTERYEDLAFLKKTYPLALEQAEKVWKLFESGNGEFGTVAFVDWCKDLDKSVAMLGVFIYTLKQLVSLAKKIGEEYAVLEKRIEQVRKRCLRDIRKKRGYSLRKTGNFLGIPKFGRCLQTFYPKKTIERYCKT